MVALPPRSMLSLAPPRWFLLLALTGGLATSCSKPSAPAPEAGPPEPVASRADRLDPLEVPEGDHKAFSLAIPRGMKVIYDGPDEVQAVGALPPERLANYVRKRVIVDGVELGAARTVFDRARIVGDPSGRPVRVEVITQESGTLLVVKNLSPPKADPNATPEERWKKFGRDPSGNLLDPTTKE